MTSKQTMMPEQQNFTALQWRRRKYSFTLIELVIVIGVTVVLFSLLLIPLISALNYTRQAQALTAAQNAARITLERITRELSSAVYVFDNTSHPFTTAGTSKHDDHYTNFLNLQISAIDGTKVLAHAYSAKLDMVMPKLAGTGTDIDPTTHEPFTLSTPRSPNGGSAFITDPSLVFPTAPGTTMVRYFVGLQDPTKPYNNFHEGKSTANDANTYILYRAQFQPYKSVGGVISVNTVLFATTPDGKRPELDDPDFFRDVSRSDINWLDDTHSIYPAQHAINATPDGSAADHNSRVENWYQIAKPVIPGPNVDLLLLPHTSSGVPAFDPGTTSSPCTSSVCNGVAHSGIAHDPVKDQYYPVVTTSVTFRPGTVSGEASPQTTTEYNSSGLPASGANTIPYIPSVYAANNQSWAQPYKVSLYAADYTGTTMQSYYYTALDATSGDVFEYLYKNVDKSSTALDDVTTGTPQNVTGNFVPLSINADSGTINFSTPALHLFTDSSGTLTVTNPIDNFNRDWVYQPTLSNSNYQVSLINDSPPTGTPQFASPLKVISNAHLVAGSLRVYGPDASAGPNLGQIVLYTQIFSPPSDSTVHDNQFYRDFDTDSSGNTLTFYGNKGQFAAGSTVKVLYDYQANMTPVGSVLTPMRVNVDYSTRDLLDVSIGVRLYDVSTGLAQIIPAESKIKIGNSSH